MNNNQKVLVAMSGGVDSSVAAFLLIQQGYIVKGVHFRLIQKDAGLEKARTIARFLKIPLDVIDLRKKFSQKVIEPFLNQYQSGLTPNPCVTCNPEIKFSALNQLAIKEGFDYFATGHYVRVKKSALGVKLLKGLDDNKDQSYFLWGLTQRILKKIIFPLGDFTKNEVKSIAKKINLPYYSGRTKEKISESQEICFAQEGIECFLKKNFASKPGNIVNDKGDVLGRHEGLFFCTLGQRKGLGLSNGPYFVKDKNKIENELVVVKDGKKLLKKEFMVKKTNWINGKEPSLPVSIRVKIRYRQDEAAGKIHQSGKKLIYRVISLKPLRAIVPGQSAVFYQNQELIGGGIIF